MDRDPSGSCGVCKAALLRENLVVCEGCRALYHHACWIYNDGRCAVYGCPQAHAERDPLPSLNALQWTGKETPLSPAPPSPSRPEPRVSSIRSDVSVYDWVILVIVMLIAVYAIVKAVRS